MNEVNALELILTPMKEMIPPPFKEDLRKIGIYTDENTAGVSIGPGKIGGDLTKEKVRIQTDVHPAQARIMTHVIEKKIIPGLYGRSDYARAAIFFYTAHIVKSLRDETMTDAYYQMELIQQMYAGMVEQTYADKNAEVVRKSAILMCRRGALAEAREMMRKGRHYMDILHPSAQEKFSNRMYGSADGRERPENWEGDEAAKLWHLVCAEDREDTGTVEVG